MRMARPRIILYRRRRPPWRHLLPMRKSAGGEPSFQPWSFTVSPESYINELFTDAAEGMGTMDYTPYLVLRGWRWHSHAGQPGLDYIIDPVEGGQAILKLIGVSRQLV